MNMTRFELREGPRAGAMYTKLMDKRALAQENPAPLGRG